MLESPEELADEWRDSKLSQEVVDAQIAAVMASVVKFRNGERGESLEEFDRNFRTRHNLN